MTADQIISEARARIIWGEPWFAVRNFLLSNGVPAAVAETRLKEFELERSRELRRMGLRNLLIGGILAGAAGLTFYLAFGLAGFSATLGLIKALAMVLMAGVYGLWKLGKGIAYSVCISVYPWLKYPP